MVRKCYSAAYAEGPAIRGVIFNNYWTRLSKISWFVSGEQVNYFLKLNAKAFGFGKWLICDKSQYFVITKFNNCLIIQTPSLFFNEYPWEAMRSAIFSARVIAKRRKAWFLLPKSRILFVAKLNWTTLHLSRTLHNVFVRNYLQVTWWALSQ